MDFYPVRLMCQILTSEKLRASCISRPKTLLPAYLKADVSQVQQRGQHAVDGFLVVCLESQRFHGVPRLGKLLCRHQFRAKERGLGTTSYFGV